MSKMCNLIRDITKIIWSDFWGTQVYDTDKPSVPIDLSNDSIHQIQSESVQFYAKYKHGKAKCRILPMTGLSVCIRCREARLFSYLR